MTTTFTLKTIAIRDDGCFSVMLDDRGQPFAVTVERTFEDGRPVIRNGRYLCRRSVFHRGGYPTFEILVAGHDRVLFHKGNTEDDSTACVIVAESFGELHGKTAVLDSKGGFNELMRKLEGLDMFFLDVTDRG